MYIYAIGDIQGCHREFQRLLDATHSVYQPNKVVLGHTGAVDPFAQSLPDAPAPRAYVCTGTTCQPATSDPVELQRLLRDRAG